MLLFMYCHYMAFLHCEMFARFYLGEPSAIYICGRVSVGVWVGWVDANMYCAVVCWHLFYCHRRMKRKWSLQSEFSCAKCS